MTTPFPKFPDAPPRACSDLLQALQTVFLEHAESLLGPRGGGKEIKWPGFEDADPRIRHSVDGESVCAMLSPRAGGSWLAAVFELAHETVHLLNLVMGPASLYEEGVAVEFSLDICRGVFGLSGYQACISRVCQDVHYAEAWGLVRLLGGDVFAGGKAVRQGVEPSARLPSVT
jgi:hypothetical protein